MNLIEGKKAFKNCCQNQKKKKNYGKNKSEPINIYNNYEQCYQNNGKTWWGKKYPTITIYQRQACKKNNIELLKIKILSPGWCGPVD